MIVNVNPYDTGFDENSHVMKFAALTREVLTTAGSRKPAPSSRKATIRSSANIISEPHRRKVTISLGKGARQNEACLDILEGMSHEMSEGYCN
jgi:kinesin family member 20